MFRVRRAIIMAAGIGKRLRPVTLDVPKPLVKVCGERMIDTAIKALHQNGITEIYVVTGYLKEQFSGLEKKYGVRLIENPYYETCNNISSLYAAREYIPDSMILDGDQLIKDYKVLSPEAELSGYNAVWTDEHTDEWLMTVKDGIVKSCLRNGGSHGWQLYSVSRWNEADGKKLGALLEKEFIQKKNTQLYWDDIPMFCYPGEFRLGIREMKQGDIVEIDDLKELAAIDADYRKFTGGNSIEDRK